MYEWIHKIALVTHIAIGSLALIVFWLPILEKKGSPRHKRAGQWFVWGMTAVSISGIVMSSMVFIDPLAIRDPLGQLGTEQAIRVVERNRNFSAFLFMLSFLVLASTRHSVLVLKAQTDKMHLKTPIHLFRLTILLLSALYIGMIGVQQSSVLFLIFSGLGTFTAGTMFHYIFKATTKPREWIIEHLTTIIGSGIGAYTAFFVFGGSNVLREFISRDHQIIFWIMPGVIGSIFLRTFAVKYRQKYKVA